MGTVIDQFQARQNEAPFPGVKAKNGNAGKVEMHRCAQIRERKIQDPGKHGDRGSAVTEEGDRATVVPQAAVVSSFALITEGSKPVVCFPGYSQRGFRNQIVRKKRMIILI